MDWEIKQGVNYYLLTRRIAWIGAIEGLLSLVKFIPADQVSHIETSLESDRCA